jgi:hypothetical protein
MHQTMCSSVWAHLVSHVHIEMCVLTAVPVHTCRRLQTGFPSSVVLPQDPVCTCWCHRRIFPVLLRVPCLGPTVCHWFAAHCRLVSFCSFTSVVWRRLLLYTADGGSRYYWNVGEIVYHVAVARQKQRVPTDLTIQFCGWPQFDVVQIHSKLELWYIKARHVYKFWYVSAIRSVQLGV